MRNERVDFRAKPKARANQGVGATREEVRTLFDSSQRLKSPLAVGKQIEAILTQVLENVPLDPAMGTIVKTLLIVPSGDRGEGVQVCDKACLFYSAGKAIRQRGVAVESVFDVTLSGKHVPLGVVARRMGRYKVVCSIPCATSPGDEMVDLCRVTRRVAKSSPLLWNEIFPSQPTRQSVLSFPGPLCFLCAPTGE